MGIRPIPAVLVALLLGLCTPPVCAQQAAAQPSKEDRVLHLLELTQYGERYSRALRQSLEPMAPMMPEGFMEKFLERAAGEELLTRVMPVYLEQLSDSTLEAAIAFYESEAGQAYSREMIEVELGAMEVGQQWGEEIGQQVMEELMADLFEEDAPVEPEFDPGVLVDQEADSLVAREDRAIGTLEMLASAQSHYVEAAITDTDMDGVGEYGWLGELGGVCAYRTARGVLSSLPISPSFIPASLGTSAVESKGIATRSGYLFRIFLPRAEGEAQADPGLVEADSSVDADQRESRFAIYAWPVEVGVTGNRAFVVTQHGKVHATANLDAQDYSGFERAPAAGAALVSLAELPVANLEGRLAGDSPASDGHLWLPIEN